MPLRNKTIVVIDDTAPIRTFLGISLQAQRANFFEASTAAEGIALCKQIQPDLVVLDLGLPDKDGLDVLPDIKQMNGAKQAPKVIILSVRKEQAVKDAAKFRGADGYMTKPFLMEDLLELIEKTITREK